MSQGARILLNWELVIELHIAKTLGPNELTNCHIPSFACYSQMLPSHIPPLTSPYSHPCHHFFFSFSTHTLFSLYNNSLTPSFHSQHNIVTLYLYILSLNIFPHPRVLLFAPPFHNDYYLCWTTPTTQVSFFLPTSLSQKIP